MRRLQYVMVVLLALAVFLYGGSLVYLYANQRALIFQASSEIIGAPPEQSIYRPMALHAPSGGRLMVWAAPPARPEFATIVFFHGNASNVSDFAGAGEVLHGRGFGIVLAAYRGYSGNDGKPTETGLMQDARAILDAAGRNGPVILWGHSLGSGVAARMASEGRGQALVLESPFTALVDVAAGAYPYFPVRLLMSDSFDTASLTSRIAVPVLILHSTDDPVVPFAMGKALADKFGAQAEFVPLQGLGHYPHQRDLTPIVTDWLQRIGIPSS